MKTKSILIIAATLLIGFALGFLTNGLLTKQRISKFVDRGGYQGFKMRAMEIIRPEQSQIKDIEPILEKYAQKVQESIAESKYEMKNIHDEMIQELEPYLDDQQIQRLEFVHRKFERAWDRHRGPRHHNRSRPRDFRE